MTGRIDGEQRALLRAWQRRNADRGVGQVLLGPEDNDVGSVRREYADGEQAKEEGEAQVQKFQPKKPIASSSPIIFLVSAASGLPLGRRAGPSGTPRWSIKALAAPM